MTCNYSWARGFPQAKFNGSAPPLIKQKKMTDHSPLTPSWEYFSFLIKSLQIISEVKAASLGPEYSPETTAVGTLDVKQSTFYGPLLFAWRNGGIPHMRTSISCRLVVC